MSEQKQNFHTSRRDFSHPLITLSSAERMYLNNCLLQELNFYNGLVENFSAIYNRSPEVLAAVTDDQVILFGNLCASGHTTRSAYMLPQFENEKEVLMSVPESLAIVFEVAKQQAAIINDTKKQMAIEILKFYVSQAKNKKDKRIGLEEQEYKTNMSTLEKYSPMQKRHLQIRRAVCNISYNEKDNKSTLTIPYIRRPVAIIEDTDLNKSGWSLAIIHQQPGIIPKQNTDWIVDFRSIGYGYMLKYLDKKYHK